MIEKEERLRDLTSALVAGKSDEARQRAYAALARENSEREVLDAIVDAVNIICDLQELGQYDPAKIASVENAVTSSLQTLEEWLAKSEVRFSLRVTVGPVGLKTGALSSLALSASLRSVGFHATNLGKTQTALDLLRNSEELGTDLVVALLPEKDDEHLRSFAEAYERGGFKNKFEIIPIAPGLPEDVHPNFIIARNSEEAISKAAQWAIKKKNSKANETVHEASKS